MRHVRLGEPLLPVRRRQGSHRSFDQGNDLLPPFHTLSVRGEAGLGGEFLRAGRSAECLPLRIVADVQHEPSVRRLKQLIRHDLEVGIALTRGHLTAGEVGLSDVHLGGEGTIEEREIDGVAVSGACPRMQARQNRGGGIETREHVRDGDPDLARRPFRRAGDAHEAAHRLDREIVAWSILERPGATEPADRADDEPRMFREQFLWSEPELLRALGAEVLDEYVRLSEQSVEDLAALGLRHVQRERALRAVARKEVGGKVAEEGRTPAAGVVSLAGAFELDDVGTQIGEELPAERPREHPCRIEHPHARQRRNRIAG